MSQPERRVTRKETETRRNCIDVRRGIELVVRRARVRNDCQKANLSIE